VEQQEADVRQAAGRVTSVDDAARFLRELRQLRDGAGLGHAELAARAHYPYDSIKAAEVGPALPDLPVLSAFVRGCGGTTEEWEERWRSLTRTPSLPVSEARSAGNSPAAAAGARIGSVAQGADNPDPSIIMAALDRVAEGMASGTDDESASPADAAASSSSSSSSSWADFPPGDSDAYPADAAAFPADDQAAFQPDAPADGFQPDDQAGSWTDAQATPFASSAAADKPAADRPAGWDPIRMSSAWPALPDSPIDAALTAEVPPWETAAWAEDPSAAAAPGRTAASAGWAKPQGTAQARADRAGADRAGADRTGADRTGAAGSAGSKTWIVVVAIAALCVLAVVLAIFA
jgi:Helix-turn-helix domain